LQGAKAFSDLTESELRLTAVVAGTVTILLFGAAVDMFGFAPCLIAALLFACAPLPVYYDRYFIHESLFAAATFGLILAGWRACRDRSIVQAALAGASARVDAGMQGDSSSPLLCAGCRRAGLLALESARGTMW
jgi:predicted membrane-bound mannosyltransferase